MEIVLTVNFSFTAFFPANPSHHCVADSWATDWMKISNLKPKFTYTFDFGFPPLMAKSKIAKGLTDSLSILLVG